MHSREQFKAVVLARLRVFEHEAKAEVLLVRQTLSVQCQPAVELADTLVHFTVLLEQLQLHRVAFGVVHSAGGDHVVDLDIRGRVLVLMGDLLSLAGVLLHETWQREFGQLSDHLDFSLLLIYF